MVIDIKTPGQIGKNFLSMAINLEEHSKSNDSTTRKTIIRGLSKFLFCM